MDRLMYVVANGTQQVMAAQTVNLNNLANSNTAGFRADLVQFDSESVGEGGLDTRIYPVAKPNQSDFKFGSINETGRDLDIAIKTDGWITVEGMGGKEAYTRAGNLSIDGNGMLVTASGKFVLGEGGPISVPPAQNVEISSDGSISILPLGQGPEALAQVDRLKLVNPEKTDIGKGEDGLFYRLDGGESESDSEVKIVSGALEGSNVDLVTAFIGIMDLARAYETEIKMMKVDEDISDSSAQIMHIN